MYLTVTDTLVWTFSITAVTAEGSNSSSKAVADAKNCRQRIPAAYADLLLGLRLSFRLGSGGMSRSFLACRHNTLFACFKCYVYRCCRKTYGKAFEKKLWHATTAAADVERPLCPGRSILPIFVLPCRSSHLQWHRPNATTTSALKKAAETASRQCRNTLALLSSPILDNPELWQRARDRNLNYGITPRAV